MKRKGLLLWLCLLLRFFSIAQQTTPSITTANGLDSLPESEVDIPIRINLKPIYALAEKNVDTIFTSPNYPADWIQDGCATRYKYYFRRSPLRLSASGTTFNLSFIGAYKIIGSTRVCAGGVVLSPWTLDCSCGFKEGERKVEIGFASSFRLQPDYTLLTRIVRTEPKPLNKCSVCFWGQDITTTVMDGMKEELDLAKKSMEDSFGVVSLKPYLQQAWNKLNETYALPYVGHLQLDPKKLRMEKISAQNDELHIQIGITATPVVSFQIPQRNGTIVPNLVNSGSKEGFSIHVEAALEYDSLSHVLNGMIAGKRFELSEGLIKKHIIVQQAGVWADSLGNMLIRMDFNGSHNGTVFFTGQPVYNAATKNIEVSNLQYDLKTKSLLLNTAKWLFNKRIINQLRKYTTFSLQQYYDTASVTLNNWLNREWTKGIRGSGAVSELTLTAVKAMPGHLLIRSRCTGKLSVLVSEIDL